jgi:hypothetical protein
LAAMPAGSRRPLGTRLIAGQIDRLAAVGQAAAGLFDGGHATSLGARRLRALAV